MLRPEDISHLVRSGEIAASGKLGIAFSLTSVGGYVDAVGYIALFQIFTANMSGNSIHIGMGLSQSNPLDMLRPLCAVSSYVVAMILTRIAIGVAGRARLRRIASFTLGAEALLLLVFFQATPSMHLGQIVDLRSPAYFGLVALLAFSMGIQTGTLTQTGALTVYTTFVAGTLTKFSETFAKCLFWLYDELRSRRKISYIVGSAKRLEDVRETISLASIWICYVVGAALGAIAKRRWELKCLYIPVVMLACVYHHCRPILSHCRSRGRSAGNVSPEPRACFQFFCMHTRAMRLAPTRASSPP